MAKLSFLMMGLSMLVAAPLASRAFASPASTPDRAVTAAETEVSLGLSVTGTRYQESFGSLSDHESGVLPGLRAGAVRLGDLFGVPGIYTGVRYDFSGGGLNYGGYLQSGTGQIIAPYEGTDRARFNTLEVRLGKAVPLTATVDLIPFIGGGYQNWYRDVGGGYGEFYRAALAGVGLKLDDAITGRLVVSMRAEGLAVVDGRASAPALGFSGGFGTSGEEAVHLGADWRLSNALHLFAGLGVRHFNYGGSRLDNGFYEPASSTLMVRSEVGLAYGF